MQKVYHKKKKIHKALILADKGTPSLVYLVKEVEEESILTMSLEGYLPKIANMPNQKLKKIVDYLKRRGFKSLEFDMIDI